MAPSSPFEEEIIQPLFKAPLPWLSRPDLSWPARRARRKRKVVPQALDEPVELPHISQGADTEVTAETEVEAEPDVPEQSAVETIPRPETPTTSLPVSEDTDSTDPTTPSSSNQIQQDTPAPGDATPIATKPPRVTKPVLPVVPALPKTIPHDVTRKVSSKSTEEAQPAQAGTSSVEGSTTEASAPPSEQAEPAEVKEAAPAPKAWTTPKLWTGLFNPAAATSTAASSESGLATSASGFGKANSESLADALRSFNAVSNDSKIAFIEPRGLVNTGNMCYMNSVLQVLIFCAPFYSFLDQISKRAAYSFKSETPLIDAMILFMREYPIIDSAATVEQLRLRLKEGELEQYGESFTPDFVYNVINRLPRFSSMRRGHQQDAEEFLGFLLEGLHDECVHVMRTSSSTATSAIATPQNDPSSPISEHGSVQGSVSGKENGWLEVGPKQKAAVTRSSGTITTGSPITKIFGGNLRSELRVPGLKDSVTLEPYQPLQLDIGAPNVNNIVDALKGLTRSEALHGDFKSPKGPNVTATKQVFIETLPPVLILHLKRFQYDNAGGTQKIWKKVGYPLELEIPKEVFPRQKRGVYAHSGLPKYRLIAAVYHHGKNASGGHYTVDVRRQDGKEWIRLDDTVIRRVRSEEVAEGGSEEDPKVLAAALEAHKRDGTVLGNGFAAIEGVEEDGEEEGWKKATGGSGKKWSSVVNGNSTPKAKTDKFSVKDNKVAYLLFYQKI
ncbi:hypothetical protein EG329_014233 [Mollisiaceae sp. DMI_Dod_QoI]|nr:hypothetical protein EG329_014233 [Helotiales sp. DMI_Dod_QoI]